MYYNIFWLKINHNDIPSKLNGSNSQMIEKFAKYLWKPIFQVCDGLRNVDFFDFGMSEFSKNAKIKYRLGADVYFRTSSTV